MFKFKTKKNSIDVLKETLLFGSGVLAGRMSDSVKHANDQIIHLNDYVRKNPNLAVVRDKLQKNPTGSALAIIGIGITLFSLFSLTQKK